MTNQVVSVQDISYVSRFAVFLRKKCILSKQLKTVKTLKRCLDIRDTILRLNIELKHDYEVDRDLQREDSLKEQPKIRTS